MATTHSRFLFLHTFFFTKIYWRRISFFSFLRKHSSLKIVTYSIRTFVWDFDEWFLHSILNTNHFLHHFWWETTSRSLFKFFSWMMTKVRQIFVRNPLNLEKFCFIVCTCSEKQLFWCYVVCDFLFHFSSFLWFVVS